ncbi:TetR family transcriptional regulator [Clostridium acetobutylicum]|nr:TetR family transcriptional regulator [Clostridium acetobutylicum]
MNPLTNRKLQAQNTKNKIYKASIELFEKKGYENLKIKDICKEAGVSIGSFYNHFDSKHAILIEVHKKADEYFKTEVKDNIISTNGIDKIIEFFDYYSIYNDFVGLDTLKQLYHSGNCFFSENGRYLQVLLQKIILEGQGKKEVTPTMTAEEICNHLFISARGVCYDWCINDGSYDLVEFMHKHISLIAESFKIN